jgi:hypothetical protein
MRFIFFTKTEWSEPPRLRHQLARLLADAGHEVVFFELPVFPWQRCTRNDSGHHRINLQRCRQGLHHKLRLHRVLHQGNANFEGAGITRIADELKVNEGDVIVNFNYDYFFLRDFFPQQRLITIINDDFWSSAIAGYERPLKWALEKTCQLSDVVLTVSPPLAEKLKAYCNPELFYPWADVSYREPTNFGVRTQLLFWGYVGERIDFNYLIGLAKFASSKSKNIEILFVGPVQRGSVPVEALNKIKNIKMMPATSLDQLPLYNVIAALIPYKTNVAGNDMIVLPNKALQLLARGLPLLITGMPDFIKRPFVFRLGAKLENDLNAISHIQDCFSEIQPSIHEFVKNNSGSQRLQQFFSYL